jgi:hypothetical protein
MESMHKAVTIGICFGMFLLMIVCLGMYYISCDRQTEMARLGYEQVQTVGHSDYVWQKVKVAK